MTANLWKCAGCGCAHPFTCECPTDIAWRTDGITYQTIWKSELREDKKMKAGVNFEKGKFVKWLNGAFGLSYKSTKDETTFFVGWAWIIFIVTFVFFV